MLIHLWEGGVGGERGEGEKAHEEMDDVIALLRCHSCILLSYPATLVAEKDFTREAGKEGEREGGTREEGRYAGVLEGRQAGRQVGRQEARQAAKRDREEEKQECSDAAPTCPAYPRQSSPSSSTLLMANLGGGGWRGKDKRGWSGKDKRGWSGYA